MKMWLIPHEEDYPTICKNLKNDIEDCLLNINKKSGISYSASNNKNDAKAICKLCSADGEDIQYLIELDIKAECIIKGVNEII